MKCPMGLLAMSPLIIYDAMGERIGSVRDGVTNRTDVAYENADGIEWRVTTQTVAGPHTNAVTVTRERLTDLSDALRSMTVTIGADGIATTNTISYGAATLVETETVSSSVQSPVLTRRVHGLVLEEETSEEITAYTYDANGRAVKVERRRPGETAFTPVEESAYSPMGDLVMRATYTNGTEVVREFYAHDHEGRVTAVTNALGHVTTTEYDARGNAISVDGATYPLRKSYDSENRQISLKTTRDGGENWDETTWTYDDLTGLLLAKTYADGSQMGYDLAIDGAPSSRVRYGYDAEGRIATLAATNAANCGFLVTYLNESGYNYDYGDFGRTLSSSAVMADKMPTSVMKNES